MAPFDILRRAVVLLDADQKAAELGKLRGGQRRRRTAIAAFAADPSRRHRPVSFPHHEFVGLDGKVVGLHRFGLSAPGAEVMKEFGIDAAHVVEAAKSL